MSIGCDYITATVKEDNGAFGLHSLGTALFRHQADIGNVPRPWGLSGFKGWKCGSVELGNRDKEFMLRLHSDSAFLSWSQVVPLADNISRLDVQATVRWVAGPTRSIEKQHRQALRWSNARKQVPIVRWVRDQRGGYTLYLGARESIVFGRIYDKYQHTKLPEHRDCVRYEVQFQNKLARQVAIALVELPSPIPRIASHLCQFFNGRGLDLKLPWDDKATYCCSRPRTEDAKTLEWLRTSVRPSVIRLIDRGRGEEVLKALGLVEEANSDVVQMDHAYSNTDGG